MQYFKNVCLTIFLLMSMQMQIGASSDGESQDKALIIEQLFNAITPNQGDALNIDEIQSIFKADPESINSRDATGNTPLMQAIRYSDRKTFRVQLLLDQGADVNAINKNGQTALIIATDLGHVNIASLLLDRGANINAADNDGMTALMLAAQQHIKPMVKLLLDRHADINLTNRAGQTALMLARDANDDDKDIIHILEQATAQVTAPDDPSNSAAAEPATWSQQAVTFGGIALAGGLATAGAAFAYQKYWAQPDVQPVEDHDLLLADQ